MKRTPAPHNDIYKFLVRISYDTNGVVFTIFGIVPKRYFRTNDALIFLVSQ